MTGCRWFVVRSCYADVFHRSFCRSFILQSVHLPYARICGMIWLADYPDTLIGIRVHFGKYSFSVCCFYDVSIVYLLSIIRILLFPKFKKCWRYNCDNFRGSIIRWESNVASFEGGTQKSFSCSDLIVFHVLFIWIRTLSRVKVSKFHQMRNHSKFGQLPNLCSLSAFEAAATVVIVSPATFSRQMTPISTY